MHIYLLLTLIATLGGGTSIIAENAVPGDILYPVKVNVNETVRGGFALSAEGNAEWLARKAERRLEEAEKLSTEGKLNAKTEARIKIDFEAQVNAALAAITKVGEKNGAQAAADLNAKFTTSIEARERAIASANANSPLLGILRIKINEATNAEIKAHANIRNDNELAGDANVNVQAAAEGKMTAAANKIAEAKKFLTLKAVAGTQATITAEAKINAAISLLTQGKVKLVANAIAEAQALFEQSFNAAQEAQQTLNGVAEVKTQVNASVKMDTNTQGILKINTVDELKTDIGY